MQIMEILYIVALFPTILIQIHPPFMITEYYTIKSIQTEWLKDLLRVILRVSIIVGAIWLAVLFGNKFDVVMSFTGNLAVSPISYIFPGFIHYMLVAQSTSDKVRDILLMVFGSMCLIFATVITIISWI